MPGISYLAVFSIALDREGEGCIGLRDHVAQELVQEVLMLLQRIGGRTAPDLEVGWAPAGGVH